MKISDVMAKVNKLKKMQANPAPEEKIPPIPHTPLTSYQFGRNAATIGLTPAEAKSLFKNSNHTYMNFDEFMDGYRSYKLVDK